MQYNKFIQSAYATIKNARVVGSPCPFIPQSFKIPSNPHNIYIELWADKGKQKIKIQQWNFKCLKTLVQSEYEENQDSQLDSVQLQKKSFLSVLQECLIKFNPKLLIKSIEPIKLRLSIVTSEKELKPFSEPHVFFISVDEYEGNGFNCRVSLQTLHTEINRKEQTMDLNSDDEEFVVLVDSAYERQRRKSQNAEWPVAETFEINSINNEQKSDQKIDQQQQQRRSKTEKYITKTQQRELQYRVKDEEEQTKIQNISINRSQREMVNMLLSKYSTKQINVTECERKMQLLNDAIQLIEELSFGNETKLGVFMRGLQ